MKSIEGIPSALLMSLLVVGLVLAGWFHLKAAEIQLKAPQPPPTKKPDDEITDAQVEQQNAAILQLQEDLEVDLRSTNPLNIYLSGVSIPRFEAWLRITNKSGRVILIDRVVIEVWAS